MQAHFFTRIPTSESTSISLPLQSRPVLAIHDRAS